MVTACARRYLWVFVVFIAFCGASEVQAAAITTLFGTGVATNDASGNPLTLVADNTNDPHYAIISVPTPDVAGQAVVTIEGIPPFTTDWAADDSLSKWISADGNQSTPNISGTREPTGTFIYETTFNLFGLDPSSAQIHGTMFVDNSVSDIVLNSTHLGGVAGANFNFGTTFSITSGFVAGLNTLDFYVVNAPDGTNPNPSGFRVAMTGTATSVPEPATIGILGIAVLAAAVRRRRSQ